MVDGTEAIAIPSPIVNFPVNEESEERHRIMSNPQIKYLYSKQADIIHDKHCICVKYISDENLLWSEEYVFGLKPCSDCMIQAYVSAGAKDSKEIEKYLAFFEKAKMSTDQIRNIYIENGMKTRISMDTMTVWHKPEESVLHNSKVNPAEKKKAKQRQAEKMEMTAVSLEEMLGERTAEQLLENLAVEIFAHCWRHLDYQNVPG